MFGQNLLGRWHHKGPNWKELRGRQDWQKYILWSLIAFLAGLTVRDVVQLCLQFASDPKQTEFKMIFNESMSLPNLTFCISKEQAFSHTNLRNMTDIGIDWDLIVEENLANMTNHESFLNEPWNFRIVVEAYEVIAALSSMERETSARGSAHTINNFRTHPALREKRRLVKMYLDVIRERNVTFTEFTQKTEHGIIFHCQLQASLEGFAPLMRTWIEINDYWDDEISFSRSIKRFERQTFNDDEVIQNSIHISWISQMQMCFQPEFDETNFKPIEDQGPFFVLLISHDDDVLNGVSVDCMTIDFHGRPSSIARFMQGKSQVMDGFNEDLCLGLRHEVYVDVRAYYEMLENDDEGTACRDPDNGQEDEFDCRSRCRLDMIRKMCNCIAHSLSYLVTDDKKYDEYPLCDYTNCVIDTQNYTDKECLKNCYRNCKQVRFQVDHEVKGPMLRKDLTMVTLNWRSFEYLSLEQNRVYTITSFIAELGGSIGVWLGLSVLSLFQGLTLLFNILRHEVIQKISRIETTDRAKQNSTPRKRTLLPTEVAVNPFTSPFDTASIGPRYRKKSRDEKEGQSRRVYASPDAEENDRCGSSARI